MRDIEKFSGTARPWAVCWGRQSVGEIKAGKPTNKAVKPGEFERWRGEGWGKRICTAQLEQARQRRFEVHLALLPRH